MSYVSGMFIGLGLSGVIPAVHYIVTDGFYDAINVAALGWLLLMAFLYISGAVIYAVRIPERIWPGKFDIWVSLVHRVMYTASSNNYQFMSLAQNYYLHYSLSLDKEQSIFISFLKIRN